MQCDLQAVNGCTMSGHIKHWKCIEDVSARNSLPYFERLKMTFLEGSISNDVSFLIWYRLSGKRGVVVLSFIEADHIDV